ncbi:chemotaxis response regulator protein-glutamate methylesterase [Desulfococcaceae bacterium HSG9]|nr:chemotaxis response regulator protein-glutamate methylesterase [Desulfococcaceae bacterium HSG9]
MKKIRILAVDDSVLARRMLIEVLSEEAVFEIIAAANGRIGLSKISQAEPDIVILDVEMPDMDGLETLKQIRKQFPELPVIMFSRLTERGASETIDALFMGANDYVAKPTKTRDYNESKQCIRHELTPKIKALCVDKLESPLHRPLRSMPGLIKTDARQRVSIVAIGVSTGGPNALAEVLSCIPSNFRVPIVIVQHMPPVFSKYLSERLTAKLSICVSEAGPGDEIIHGQAFLAPGGFHMTLGKNGAMVVVRTNRDPPVNNCRPAVDLLFESVARIYGSYALGVILTGMGYDGLKGCEYIKKYGGQVLVQDKASSSVWGMPKAVADAGLADKILPLKKIGNEILEIVGAK